jgi:hypothetical protein
LAARIAVAEANILAMAASLLYGSPESHSQAAL